MRDKNESTWRNAYGLFDRPELVVWAILLCVGGVAIGFWMLPEQWSPAQRGGAGLALGVGALLSIFAPRMIGGKDYD